MKPRWTILVIATLMFLFTIQSAMAAPGDVIFRDYANGTLTALWGGDTANYAYSAGWLNNTAPGYIRNITNVSTSSGIYNFSFVMHDTGAAISNGQYVGFAISNYSTMSNPVSSGNSEWGVEISSGSCNTFQTTYHVDDRGYADCPTGTAVTRITGITYWTFIIDLNTDQARYYKNGVNTHNSSLPSGYTIRSVTWFDNAITQYRFDNITICEEYCGSAAPASVNTITVSLSNVVNGSSWPSSVTFSNLTGNLSFAYFNITGTGYCVTVTGNGTSTNCTTTGSGSSTFFNVSNNSVSVTGTQTINAAAYQAILNVSAFRLFLNTSISSFNGTNNQAANQTTTGTLLLQALNGTNNVQISVAGNYSKNVTCTVSTLLTTTVCNATGIYDDLFTIGAKNRSSQGLSSFSVNVTQATLGGLLYASTTTTGNTTFALLQGYDYFFNIHADGYANDNETLAANASTNLYNFSLYTQDSVNISFYDEETNALLSGTTVSIDFISELSSFNTSTTTGHLFVDLLVPGDYTLRYSAPGYDEKFYLFTLVDDTFTAINLTLLNSSSGTAVTITVKDTLDIPVVGAIVKVLRFNINTNTYETVEILTTNFEGITVASLSLNDEFYKFMVEYDNEVVLTTEASQVYGTTLTLFVDLIGGSGFGKTFTRYDLSGSIAYLNTSASFRFNFNDATNTASQGCLVVYELSETKMVYNQSCSASSSGSITVGIDNSTGQSYQAVGTVTVGDTDYTVAQYLLNFGEVIPEDGSGLLMMFFMILVFVFAMAVNIEVAIIAGSFVPMMFTAMGLSRLDYTTTMFIFAFGLVVAFIIGVVRR